MQTDMVSVKQVVFHHLDEISDNSTLNLTCPIEPSTYVFVSNTTEESRRKIIELASQVSDSDDVETLLDHVKWEIFVSSCQQPCNSFNSRQYEEVDAFCPSNSSCCFTNSADAILAYTTQCGSTTCTSFTNEFLITKWYIFFVLGLLCLFGNFIVIYNKIKSLRKKLNRDKEVQIYNVLVLNLALADFFMGIYLTAIAFEIKYKVAKGLFFSEHGLCNVLGAINALSVQVSTTVLLIISFYRLIGVMFPFKKQQIKLVIALGCITWLVWLGMAFLPFVPLEPLKTTFTFGLAKERMLRRESLIDFLRLTTLFRAILNANAASANNSEIKLVLQAVIDHPNVSVLRKVSSVLGLVSFERENWSLVGYYDLQFGCATGFFITNEKDRLFNYFTSSFLFFNFFSSVTMLIVYLMVSCRISRNGILLDYICNCCDPGKKLLQKTAGVGGSNLTAKCAENKKLYRRISVVVITNLLCWLPLSITALTLSYQPSKTGNGEQVVTTLLSIQTAMLLVVPLNSILNPYIYSYHLWKDLFAKMKSKLSSNTISIVAT